MKTVIVGPPPGSSRPMASPRSGRGGTDTRRIPLLVAGLVPVLVGSAIALVEGGARIPVALATGLFGVMLALLWGIRSDRTVRRDIATAEKEPSSATGSRIATVVRLRQYAASQSALTATILFTLASSGIYLAFSGGRLFVVFVALAVSTFVVIRASTGPTSTPLVYSLLVFLFVGPVATTAVTLAHTGEVHELALAAGIPVGCLTGIILTAHSSGGEAVD